MVKITIWSLLLLTGTAFADSNVQLARLGPAEPAPTLVRSCTAQKPLSYYVTDTKLDQRVIDVLRDCGDTDAHARLAFQAKDSDKGMHLYTSAVIAGGGIQLSTEVFTFGKLKGDKHALLHRVDTRHGDQTSSQIDVCTFDTDGTPMCGSASVECPETGCKPPEIIKGALWIHAKDGRKRFAISLPGK